MTPNYDLGYIQDPDRLSTLHELDLLDTPAEKAFDRLTRLASLITNSPISLISLVDADRQFFKSLFGLPEPLASERETPLSHSFCQHVVASKDALIVPDAREHPVLKDNPGVSELNIIAYLGMPLTTTDGVELGSFCVVDTKPHEWDNREIEIIRELAISVMTEIELRAAEKHLAQRNMQYRRAYHFSHKTLEHMKQILLRGSEPAELLEYINQMEQELNRL